MLICFDLDGVLIDAADLHFHAFNTALAGIGSQWTISYTEHLAHYNGLPTRTKLGRLTDREGFPEEHHDLVWATKQAITERAAEQIPIDPAKQQMLANLRADGHTLACCSNSTQETTWRYLLAAGLHGYFDWVAGASWNPKPASDCYLDAMRTLGFSPRDTWIVEDSPVGLQAAHASGAHVIPVNSPAEVTYAQIAPHLWDVLIPMAGAGSRFGGYTFPKPLIDVDGRPMIQAVVDNLDMPGRHIFIVRKEHEQTYAVADLLELIAPGCEVVFTDGLTEGAACSALLARDLLGSRPVLIANADQLVDWDRDRFVDATVGVEGLIATFTSTHPKWSYVRTDHGRVVEVAEKRPVSSEATCGIYWWRDGFVTAADRMIEREDRTNGEFYIAPVFNHTDGEIRTFPVETMHGLGTPEDLERFLRR